MSEPTRIIATRTTASPWPALVTGPGVLKSLNISAASLNGVLSIFDALTATGTPIAKMNPGSSGSALSTSRLFNLPFVNGLSMSYSQTITRLTIATVTADDPPRNIFISNSVGSSVLVVTGAGVLKGINTNNGATAAAILSIFDSVTPSGTQIAQMNTAINGNDQEDFDLPFTNGICIGVSGGPLAQITVTYTT